ncbi:THUMP domain-containing class I SAM-dependent RNA methyltransferase [Domibacillus epiphyticus]|uniref:RNA methyltransferase n=1 Tax=Domibacillus epiphyticus TaxID=1714355 RepID=A0A1V2A3T2_9BACI|nr:class I SAM-dependent RNA methyltransferase [Domibacillus epiphyticus]OMP65659.1 RNA methyltransferase [Domibacillus epiphyticus]
MTYTLIATAAMGLEALVAKEIKELGYAPRTENGKVYFEGDDAAIARCNMWLRTADRVKVVAAEFYARTFDELFEKTKAIEWEQFLPKDASFPVQGKSVKSTLFSVSDCQAIVKKAIAERLKRAYKLETWLPETGALFPLEVALLKDKVTITLDTSGAGLHKRGYRTAQGEAPLKETLAAALVQLTNWYPDKPFVDPFCGSGTIPIEAALIGQNIAPGFNRDFISEQWPWTGEKVWDDARMEAEDKANYDQPLDIEGLDKDPNMINIASSNAFEAGLGDLIKFRPGNAEEFITDKEYGVIVGNPPYGERLSDRPAVEKLYSELGRAFEPLNTWSIYMLTSYEQFEEVYGKPATKKRKLFNGFIRCDYYQYWGKRPPRRTE